MMSDSLIGRSLNNYRIERLLGRGGMARVYYGWDIRLERPIAIKVIDPVEQQNPAYARRLVQEARAIANWRHEHIVQVYYADAIDHLYYFAMEYIEGRDLGDLLDQYAGEGTLVSHEDVLRIGWAVAKALDYAHAQGVIHRDVKPSNVMVANDGRIVLTDFGLALDASQGTMDEAFGTPHYMAPEQVVQSSSAVPQSDLYSLGVILYEMLTGRVPFDDPSPISVAVHHISEPVPPPSSLNPAISLATEAVLLKALSKEPGERFSSGEALMAALEQSFAADPSQEPTRKFSPVSIADRIAGYETDVDSFADTLPSLRQSLLSAAPHANVPHRRAVPGIALGMLVCLIAVTGAALWLNRSSGLPIGSQQGIALVTSTLPVIERSGVAESAVPVVTVLTAAPGLPTASATPTAPAATGYRVVLYYTDTGFYLWNPGDEEISIRPIAFETVDAAGAPARYRFRGNQWAEYYEGIMPGFCDALEVADQPYTNRPAECAGYNATRTPPRSADLVFWIPREGITGFRVLWEDEEIARCEIAAGVCEVYLPD